MKPCISQATTLNNPFEADLGVYRGGWLDGHRDLADQARNVPGKSYTGGGRSRSWNRTGSSRPRRRRREACCSRKAPSAQSHWDHFRRRLALLQELDVPTLIVTPDFVRQPDHRRICAGRRRAGRGRRAGRVVRRRIALEFQKSSPICSCLETALALIAQSGAANAGVCFDVFHYYTGPSKFEDLAYLSPRNLAWVQVCDVSGTPRELAGDGDRILPGEGDFQLGPIIEQLGRIGYDGYVSLEVLNPHLWQVAADRVADLGHQALLRRAGPAAAAVCAPAKRKEGFPDVVGDPPAGRGGLPRRAILRLAGLCPDRTRWGSSRGSVCCAGASGRARSRWAS